MRVYLQKHGHICEFLEYDIVMDKADSNAFLGEVSIRDGMDKTVLVAKLRDAANRIEKSKKDIFVLQ